jgi:hypothetical protein
MKISVCCGVKGTEMSIGDDGKGDVLFTITFVAPVKAGEFIDFVVEKKALQKFLRTIQKEPKKNSKETRIRLSDSFFRKLREKEEKEFRKWAHQHPKDTCTINPELIHPVVRDEWEKIKNEV